MPNHVHLLLDTSAQLPFDENDFDIEKYQYLKDIMCELKGKTGLLLNKERGTSGSVWFPKVMTDIFVTKNTMLIR